MTGLLQDPDRHLPENKTGRNRIQKENKTGTDKLCRSFCARKTRWKVFLHIRHIVSEGRRRKEEETTKMQTSLRAEGQKKGAKK